MPNTVSPRRMIDDLVAFDTTSRESNLELIGFVRDYLAGFGVDSALVHNEDGRKANLYATVGPDRDGGVVLSGHTDVVPVDGQDWSSDPFAVREADGRLYGRGTADMKGFIATALALVPEMQARPLSAPLHFALSYDEEVGCLGVHGLIDHLKTLTTRPKAVIVGEPTSMKVVNAHKGACALTTRVHGLEAHSSATDKGLNSIFHAAELIQFIAELAEEAKLTVNERFDPPYTTVHVGTIQGGTALNIIPKETSFRWEFRSIPGHDDDGLIARFNRFAEDVVLPKMRAIYPQAAIETRIGAHVVPLMPQDGSAAETLVLALAGSNATHAVSYCTEAGIFQEFGVPTVICGPGSIDVAHKPDEYVELSQVAECESFLRGLIGHLQG
mgnify:CR=1 FL=1